MGPAVTTINDNHVTDVILVVVIKYWFSVVGPLLVYSVVSQRVLWTLTQDVLGQGRITAVRSGLWENPS